MNKIAKIIIASVVVIAIVSVVLTVFIPSHTGEIRQDLQVGDYYEKESTNLITGAVIKSKMTVTGFTDNGDVKVRMTSGNITRDYTQTKSEFLNDLLFESDLEGYNSVGYAILETNFGSRFCTIYQKDDSQYWVGEHDIIYKSSLYGMTLRLTGTSLIIE